MSIKPTESLTESINLLNKISNEKDSENLDKISKAKEFILKQENYLEKKFSIFKKERIFRPTTNYSFEYNDPLRIYFDLIEYGMNKDITFQKNLVDLLKKKKLIDDANKDSSSSNFSF